jgi:hypothetical protein
MNIESIDQTVASVKREVAAKTGFELTDAVCPINGFAPTVGFQRAIYVDSVCGRVQLLVISQTKGSLFGLFVELLEKLISIGKVKRHGVDAVFESRYNPFDRRPGFKYDVDLQAQHYRDFIAEGVDPICFLSKLWDYEDLFVNDGFSGVSLMSEGLFSELRLDVHKTILLFSKSKKLIRMMAEFLRGANLPEMPTDATGIADEPHLHIGHSDFRNKFDQLVASENAEPFVAP